MLENGADVRFIQAMLGHATLETTEIYTHVSIRKLKAVHELTHPGKMEKTSPAEQDKEGLAEDWRMSKLLFMKFNVTVDRDEDGYWVAECPSIPGCVSQGEDKESALVNIREAIQLCLEVRSERGMPLTVETRQVEVAL